MTHFEQLQQAFPEIEFKANEPLAPFTTVKIGGPAEVFCLLTEEDQFAKVVQFAKQHKIPVTILGWGANSLISDEGLKGLVIKNSVQAITVHPEETDVSQFKTHTTQPRWQAADTDSAPSYEFEDLDYQEDDKQRVLVTMSTGVSLPAAINNLLRQGITGLQWYSRIPATVGGAIYNNIHGGTHFIGEVVAQVKVVTPEGEIKTLKSSELDFEYDYSRFHTSNETIISVDFLLYKGDVEKAQQVSFEWAKRKAVQPQNSLGCIFQNLTEEDQQRLNLPTPSIGYLIQHVLHLQGFTIGDAQVSKKHAAFIENLGHATAKDYLNVIKEITSAAREKCNLELTPEIFFLGFTAEQLEGIVQPR